MPMLAYIQITPWLWVVFVVSILAALALDLGVFHRHAREVRFKEALAWSLLWFLLSMGFAVSMLYLRGHDTALAFLTGYLIELSLSMDNVFVMALIFAYFRIPAQYQHRVLFWGILGALLMRGLMIAGGAALIARFHWTLYVFGAFLVFTGIKMCFGSHEGVHPEKNPVIRLARKIYPVSPELDGQRFFTRWQGRRAFTPLALVLIMVETTDLVFALDSIPAIFAITRDAFIVFTSNVFAILGLRSMYFVLAGAIRYFRYLKYGLSVVLVFIGLKMLAEMWGFHLGTAWSLGVVGAILLLAVLASVLKTRAERAARGEPA